MDDLDACSATGPPGHVPVLAEAVGRLLEPQPGDVVLDATLGGGGHALLLGEAIGPSGLLIGLDLDASQLRTTASRLAILPCRVELRCANFLEASGVLNELGVEGLHILLVDLGVSSLQLDTPERGFSFLRDGPLDMRMNPSQETSAADLVNRLKEKDMSDLLYHLAQEPRARRIAKWICEARRDRRILTTGRLATIVAEALGVDPESRREKIHPATRTFMALRMAVNREIENLNGLLEDAPALLRPGGRIGIISFHSVEDKAVKLSFRKRKADGILDLVTKKPVVADEAERRRNPRSRSAKLRVAVRRAD